jgi:hypothetical protein
MKIKLKVVLAVVTVLSTISAVAQGNGSAGNQ